MIARAAAALALAALFWLPGAGGPGWLGRDSMGSLGVRRGVGITPR